MRGVIGAVMVAALAFGCGKSNDQAAVSKDLQKKGTLDLLKEIDKDKYSPPADGKLSESQVQMYLKVREREKVIAQTAREEAQQHAKASDSAGKSVTGFMEGLKTLGSAADLATADVRAAHDLGFNTREYTWVKGQILAASAAAATEGMTKAINTQLDTAYEQAKKAYDEAKDEQTKQMYKQVLDQYDQTRKESAANAPKVDPAVAYNRELLSKHEDALNALGAELAKWGAKDADVKKAVQQAEEGAKK
jgi:hypothetical protein